MLFKPVSWIPSETDITIIGYNDKNQSVLVELPRRSTYILQFGVPIDEAMITDTIELLEASNAIISPLDPTILVVRGPQINPKDHNLRIEVDPYGGLQSLWADKELGPYEWLYISNYVPIFNKNQTFDLMIRSTEDDLEVAEGPDLPLKLLFWDLEVFGEKPGIFPKATHPGDYIFMISVITSSKMSTLNYVICCGSVNDTSITNKNITLVKVANELEVIKLFFTIYSNFNPDWQVYYNGDLFDVPYLLRRMAHHQYKVPKIKNREPKISNDRFEVSGLESVDLLDYFRRYHPELQNHKLDTVAMTFMNKGKAPLSISDMMTAVRTNNKELMAQVVDYSYTDSLRMVELFTNLNIQNSLYLVCNNLGISLNNLLKDDFNAIIDRAVYTIEPSSILSTRGPTQIPIKFKMGTPGIYRDVFEYDYSELYRLIMANSEDHLISELGDRLSGAPSLLIVTAFYSSYVNRTTLKHQIMDYLTPLIKDPQIISIDTTTIRTRVPISYSWLSVLNHYPGYIEVDKTSRIVLTSSNNIYLSGLGKLTRPTFELASEMITNYVRLWFQNKRHTFEKPKILSHDKLSLCIKLERLDKLEPESLKYKLALQYDADLTHEICVTYLMTTRGPVLQCALSETDIVDEKYYDRELDQYLEILRGLKEIK